MQVLVLLAGAMSAVSHAKQITRCLNRKGHSNTRSSAGICFQTIGKGRDAQVSVPNARLTLPLDQGRLDLHFSALIEMSSGSVQTARIESARAVVFIRNSVGD